MSAFQEKLKSLEKYLPDAIDALWETYSELLLSLDKEQVVNGIVAYLRLNGGVLTSESDATSMVVVAFANLLSSQKLTIAPFGLSVLGRESLNELLAFVNAATATPLAPPAPVETPEEKYQDVVQAFAGSAVELNRLMRTPEFKKRVAEAEAAGVIL